jgi:hypothetical protein
MSELSPIDSMMTQKALRCVFKASLHMDTVIDPDRRAGRIADERRISALRIWRQAVQARTGSRWTFKICTHPSPMATRSMKLPVISALARRDKSKGEEARSQDTPPQTESATLRGIIETCCQPPAAGGPQAFPSSASSINMSCARVSGADPISSLALRSPPRLLTSTV